MITIILALMFFASSVVAHIIVCRQRPQGQLWMKAFCGIAAFNLLLLWFCFYCLSLMKGFLTGQHFLPLTATVLYILLIPSYAVFYVTTQLNSPSKTVLVYLQEHPGASKEDLLAVFTDEYFVLPRLNDLLSTACVKETQGRYLLTGQGERIAAFLNAYQFFLGRAKGA